MFSVTSVICIMFTGLLFFKLSFCLYFLEIVFDAIMCNYDFQR